MINYITKAEMTEKFGKNYFGLVKFFVEGEPKIYIRSGLPERVTKFIEAHELQHVKDGVNGSELNAFIAGVKITPIGALQTILMSLTPSRLRMYPIFVTLLASLVGILLLAA